jgi:hypothetical protein
MVTGGHPGDPEYGCGGTIARYADQGHDVALVYLNRGEKSCPETPADAAANVRVAEAKRACEIRLVGEICGSPIRSNGRRKLASCSPRTRYGIARLQLFLIIASSFSN